MTADRSSPWLGLVLTAAILFGASACSSSSDSPSATTPSSTSTSIISPTTAVPDATVPSGVAALFVEPPARLKVTDDDGGPTDVALAGPTVEGQAGSVDAVRAYKRVWATDAGDLYILVQINEMADAATAQRRQDAELQHTTESRFDVTGLDGAVGLTTELSGDSRNTVSVYFTQGSYFVAVSLLTAQADAQQLAVELAQAQAAHLREMS